MRPENRYIALIGDVVSSRSLTTPRRGDLQERLEAALALFPPSSESGVAARPLITLGDEFQALMNATDSGALTTLTLVFSVLDATRPVVIRFGIGIGTLTTKLREESLGMDGPCFHRARRAQDRARREGSLCELEAEGCATGALWSALAAYVLKQRVGWTEAQNEAIDLYRQLGAWKKVAARLGVSPSAVSLRQRAAGWSMYCRAMVALQRGLQDVATRPGPVS
jgi:hypothetical protein